jgi:hypothetical protein
VPKSIFRSAITEEEYQRAQSDAKFAIPLPVEKYRYLCAREMAELERIVAKNVPTYPPLDDIGCGSGGGDDFPCISVGIVAACLL